MPAEDPWGAEVDFDQLSWLGRVVYLSGHVARAAGSVLEIVVDSAAGLITDTEQAFRAGLDPDVEDAKILAEYHETAEDHQSSDEKTPAAKD
ncbi:MAG: hypothetical protein ACI9W4_001624 [Rhodothermales bacterium]